MSTTENANNEKLCITVREFAKRLSIGTTMAYKLANDKRFYPAKKVYGKYVIILELLNQWLKED